MPPPATLRKKWVFLKMKSGPDGLQIFAQGFLGKEQVKALARVKWKKA